MILLSLAEFFYTIPTGVATTIIKSLLVTAESSLSALHKVVPLKAANIKSNLLM